MKWSDWPGLATPEKARDAPADRFDISRARAGLGAAELLNHRGMLPLGLGDVARVEIARSPARRNAGRERKRGRGEQQDEFTHHASPIRAQRTIAWRL